MVLDFRQWCILKCCREVHSNVILTRFSSHDGLPEEQLLREGQPGPALDWAIGDKGDRPVVRAVWWICLVTQCAPCRDRRGQQALKTYNSSYSAISSLPVCFSSAPANSCFCHVQLVHLSAFTQKNMDRIVTDRRALTCQFLSNSDQMCGSPPTFLMVNWWPRLQTIPRGAMGQSPLFIKATAKWMTASPVLVVMLVMEELQNFTLITSEMSSTGRKI